MRRDGTLGRNGLMQHITQFLVFSNLSFLEYICKFLLKLEAGVLRISRTGKILFKANKKDTGETFYRRRPIFFIIDV